MTSRGEPVQLATTADSGRLLLPSWLPGVLVAAAVPGVLLSLVTLWWCFVGTGPYIDPAFPPSSDVSFVERAAWWLDLDGFGGPFATLTALIAFWWASARLRSEGAVESVLLRILGLVLAGVMAIVQAGGVVAVVVGELLLLDSTGGRDPWSTLNRFRVSALVSSLILAALFVVLTGVLRSRLVADAVPAESPPDTAPEPQNGNSNPSDDPMEDNEIRSEDNASALFQRPRGRPGV